MYSRLIFFLCLGWLSVLSVRAQETSDQEREEAALAQVQKLREEILQGGNFAALAREYSDDPATAPQGGELGFIEPGALVPEYEAAVAALKAGELTEPVRTKFGYHLIQLIERKGDRINTRHILVKP